MQAAGRIARHRLAALALLASIPALALTLPLGLAIHTADLDMLQLSAREATGTVWSGDLRSASLRGIPVGDASVRLAPLALLGGVARVSVDAAQWSGDLLAGRINGVEGVSGALALDPLDATPGMTLLLRLSDVDLSFSRGRCQRAAGEVGAELQWTSTGGLASGADAAPVLLAGRVTCSERVATIELTGATEANAGAPVVNAMLEIEPDGRYQLRALVTGADDTTRLALEASGFQDGPSGLSRVDEGSLLAVPAQTPTTAAP
ncbi:MAG: type II secretion system protein N [Pseudomonadota bacterium]|nr:type II secretion system protein N [Pseudomonadota bacterium]